MKCGRCFKPATTHITELRQGEVEEIHLCDSCATDYVQHPDSASMDEDQETVGAAVESDGLDDLSDLDQLVCPNCGISFKEFRSQGRLGCPNDYIVFQQELLPLLENIHNDTEHCGKVPKRAPDASRRQYELIKLRGQLKTAVEEENYEEAARLRDAIQKVDERESDEPHEDA